MNITPEWAVARTAKVREALRKGYVAEGATRAAIEAERRASESQRSSWMPSWSDVSFDRPYDGPIQRQITKPEPAPAVLSPTPAVPEASPVESMPSRFHAIMAELKSL